MAVFDGEAEKYDEWYQSVSGAFVDQVESGLALQMLPVVPGMKVLDAGCGTGNFSQKLAAKGAEVTAVDISAKMLKKAKDKLHQKSCQIDFLQADLHKLPFPDKRFDAVLSMAVFEFFNDPQPVFDELFRVLKPGGNLLIGTINKDSSWGNLYESEDFQENTVFRHASFKTMEELKVLSPETFVMGKECLFVPPTAAEEDFNLQKEKELAETEKGGFICALWKKAE